jgi:outer membrane PBP1 activator LpoA protein
MSKELFKVDFELVEAKVAISHSDLGKSEKLLESLPTTEFTDTQKKELELYLVDHINFLRKFNEMTESVKASRIEAEENKKRTIGFIIE